MVEILNKFSSKNKYHKKAFFYALGLSFLMFIPFIIYDKGYFLYYGDFNVQQIPFYQMVHDSIRNGEFFWNWNTDLGVNLIGSYSFYLITSPFFWLTIPFNSEMIPYLMAPLLMLKFACASLTAFIYIKRYVKNQNVAVLGGILYAFSGFSIYNIFFNHFHEAIVIFPLLLWSLDLFMYDKKRGIFGILVFLSCFINYYFFVGQVVFLIIYWTIKMLLKRYRCSLKDFLLLLLESLLGVAASMVVLLPSILAIIQNPRLDEHIQGWSAILYNNEQRYLHIISSLFFPPDIPARPNFTPDSNSKWASIGAWIPMFGMCGVIAFLQSKKGHWLKRLMVVLFIFAMVPILNSSFQLFNSCYYARWFYMATLMMSLATVLSLESSNTDWTRAIKWSLVITLSIASTIGLMPHIKENGDDKKLVFGLENNPLRFWVYVLIAVVSITILVLILNNFSDNKRQLFRLITIFVMVISLISSIFIIGQGKKQSYSTHDYIIPYVVNGKDKIDLPDTKNCRADFYDCIDNQGMFWQVPTIQAFHSIVPGSIMEFYPSIGVKRDVGSRPETKVYGIRSLLSCRWLFDYKGDTYNFSNNFNGSTAMPGFKYYDNQNGHDIWENEYYIPFGFSYDYYMTRDQFEGITEDNRHLALLKAIVLDDDAYAKYSDVLSQYNNMSFVSYTQEAYFRDCKKRKEVTCYYFDRDNRGFTAKVDLTNDKDRIIFFSVPYEKGWSATVNGKKVDISRANIGFMAVRAEGGLDNTIRFTYKTPGLLIGAIISIISIILFLIYRILINRIYPEPKEKNNRLVYSISDQSGYEVMYISRLKHRADRFKTSGQDNQDEM